MKAYQEMSCLRRSYLKDHFQLIQGDSKVIVVKFEGEKKKIVILKKN